MHQDLNSFIAAFEQFDRFVPEIMDCLPAITSSLVFSANHFRQYYNFELIYCPLKVCYNDTKESF
jgi:hypothetical protein